MARYKLRCWSKNNGEQLVEIDALDANDAILKAAARIVRIRRSKVHVYDQFELTDCHHKPVKGFQEIISNGEI